MATLAQFPSEILSIVTSCLNGFDIVHLWLSGDPLLMVRLENGGVTRFDLALAQTVSFRWPTVISRFKRLDSLSIRPRSEFHHIWFRDVDFSCIPSSIRHLELEFENIENSFLGIPFFVFDAHPDPIWSPPARPQPCAPPFILSEHWPDLQTLRLRGKMTSPSILLPMLPSSLVSLHLSYKAMLVAPWPLLPPNLTHLELPDLDKIARREMGLPFPPKLTHLDLASFPFPLYASVSCLPNTLTYLNTHLGSFSCPLPSADQLPPLVTLIDRGVGDLNGEFSKCLPVSLRHYEAPNRDITRKFEILPPALQTLVIFRSRDICAANIPQLPHSLTQLSLRVSTLTQDCLLFLPASIRILALNINFPDVGTPYSFVPTLEVLKINTLDTSALRFAPKLHTLRFSDLSAQSDPSLTHLTSLTILHMIQSQPFPGVSFPSTLTELTTFDLISASLPCGLKSLVIENECDLWRPSAPLLPPGLTHLSVNERQIMHSISDADILLLPQSIEYLAISDTSQITDNGIANLPRHMRYCELGNASLLTNACASLFPRQLTLLRLSLATQLSKDFLKLVPRTLRSLQILEDSNLKICPKPTQSTYLPSSNLIDFQTSNPKQWK